jgi:hypothetical protein
MGTVNSEYEDDLESMGMMRESGFNAPLTLNMGWNEVDNIDLDDGNDDMAPSLKTSTKKRKQVVYACTVAGSLFAIYRIPQDMYDKLISLQNLLAAYKASQPLLGMCCFIYCSVEADQMFICTGNKLALYRSCPRSASNVLDGEMLLSFSRLTLGEQCKVAESWNLEWNDTEPLRFLQYCIESISRM